MLNHQKNESTLSEKDEQKEPAKQHGLFLLNSDYTEYGCVIGCLTVSLALGQDGSQVLAEKAHKDGEALIGTWNKDIAETKAYIAHQKLCELHLGLGLDEPTTIFSVREI